MVKESIPAKMFFGTYIIRVSSEHKYVNIIIRVEASIFAGGCHTDFTSSGELETRHLAFLSLQSFYPFFNFCSNDPVTLRWFYDGWCVK